MTDSGKDPLAGNTSSFELEGIAGHQAHPLFPCHSKTTMEEELLKDMIQERDKKIAQLAVKIEGHEKDMSKVQEELEQFRAGSTDSKLERRREIAALLKARDLGLIKIQKKEKEVRNQNGSLHLYADILKEAAPESVDSSYVIRMQSQLCKAMHSMGILEHQLHIVNQISSDVVKTQKDAITAVAEGKTKMELEMMNELVLIDDAKKQVEEEYKPKLEKEQLAVVELRKRLGENDEAAGSDSESEDELEVEMREGLEELKEAIAEMEEETEEQLKTIDSLRAQLKELKMDPDEEGNGQVSHEEEKKMNP